ncbi:uncharacterized protein ASPGLDRAFT_1492464 [Aspergillus glaucus CBS 516.65]|uniref:Uncharacterized protein n=1 Tax=Aspergillus glaucus CBS 516.65 TaxID=1160497 RepID=A0A1L9VJG4_ASPGL|nr:hypothetical protein ASPGLDRAFT_1492464 [Aspergillus glaucus CBS 516.65]OJJ84033.1 hypothetical protein ASPGLDRAFT_1492464 [Aspergillus glaucus CBS 516.65]
MSKPEPTTTTEALAPKCYLLKCPNEIIIEIASYLELKHAHAHTLLNASNDLQTILHIPFYNRAYSHWRDPYYDIKPSFYVKVTSMLEWAAKKGYANIIQELQARDEQALSCEMKNIALADAAARGHLSCVKCAAFIGHIAIVELLLKRGAAPGEIAGDSSIAVEHAFKNNQEECAKNISSERAYTMN